MQQRGSNKLELVCADRLSESEGNKFHPAKFFLNGARGYILKCFENFGFDLLAPKHISVLHCDVFLLILFHAFKACSKLKHGGRVVSSQQEGRGFDR